VPPWFSCTVPSAYTSTSAPAWFSRLFGERDAELHRLKADAALDPRASVGVERGDLGAALGVVALCASSSS
jgi:hypothetical protein